MCISAAVGLSYRPIMRKWVGGEILRCIVRARLGRGRGSEPRGIKGSRPKSSSLAGKSPCFDQCPDLQECSTASERGYYLPAELCSKKNMFMRVRT